MDEKFVKIDYDATNKIVFANWIGFLKLEDVQKGCQMLSSLIKKEKLTNHISDQTQLKVLSKEVQDYLVGVWFDEAEKLGLTKIAVIVAEDVFAQAAVNKVNLNAQYKKIEINSFNSLIQCHNWLNEKVVVKIEA